jgi:hypothetical protein
MALKNICKTKYFAAVSQMGFTVLSLEDISVL